VMLLRNPHGSNAWKMTLLMFILFFLIIGIIVFIHRPKVFDAKEEIYQIQSDEDRLKSELRKGTLTPVESADTHLKTPLAISTRSPNLNSLRQIAAPSNSRMGSSLGFSPKGGMPFAGVVPEGIPRENSSASHMLDNEEFCPALKVPKQCECILVVPVVPPGGSFDICDANGLAVLQCTLRQGSSWQLDLWTTAGKLLARCIQIQARFGSNRRAEFHVLDAKAQRFATLTAQLEGETNIELTMRNGYKINLWGNVQTQAVNITDDKGSLLATTEPYSADQIGMYYRLRVAPLANVAHSLCALLCIGQVLSPR